MTISCWRYLGAILLGWSALSDAAHGQAPEKGSLRLSIEDALGETRVQPAVVYDSVDGELEKPLAKSANADQPISLPPGSYWVLSASDDSLKKLVTLAAGEKKDVTIKLERGLWISFDAGAKNPPDKVLMVLRPKAEMERWLRWSLIQGMPPEAAALRPEATAEELEAARKGALAAPVLKEPSLAPATMKPKERESFYTRRSVELPAIQRILAVTGKPEDVDTLLKLATSETSANKCDDLASWAGLIEAKNDILENGRLMAMVRDKDEKWAFPAAIALRRFGLPVGQDLVRGNLKVQKDMWPGSLASYSLRTDSSPVTLKAMRDFVRAGLEAHKSPWNLASACLYLLTYGEKDDWKIVGSMPFERAQVGGLACLAQNPHALIGYALPFSSMIQLSQILPLMHDLDATELAWFCEWLNDAAGTAYTKGHPAEVPSLAYNSTVNSLVLLESCWIPHPDAVRFYRGFDKERISDSLADGGRFDSLLTWFPYPESVDIFVKEWLDGGTRYFPQLDYVPLSKIEDAVKRLGKGRLPPGYELYCAYHRIAHRQRFVYDPFPMGVQRWPYLFAYREHDQSGAEQFGGGISGVASLKTGWRDKTLLVSLKLDQRADYEQAGNFLGIGNRSSKTQYPHHRYMVRHGRPLIDSVVVRRGLRRFVATDTEKSDGDWLLFEAPLDSSSLADLWVDVNLKFIDQSITLSAPLFAGGPANLMRQQRYLTASSKEEKKQSSTSNGGPP
jgi:hypothetical protein